MWGVMEGRVKRDEVMHRRSGDKTHCCSFSVYLDARTNLEFHHRKTSLSQSLTIHYTIRRINQGKINLKHT